MVDRKPLRALVPLVFLGCSVLLLSCRGYIASTVFPAHLQRADTVINLSEFPGLAHLKGRSFQTRIQTFTIPTPEDPLIQRTFVGIQIFFPELARNDLIILLTEDLRYIRTYTRENFLLPFGYKLGRLFSEGYGNRILVGFDYQGDDPALSPQLIAFDPYHRHPFIAQVDTGGVFTDFQGGIVQTSPGAEGTWIAQTFNNIVNFTRLPSTYLPPTPSPPATGINIPAFSTFQPLSTVTGYLQDPRTTRAALLLRASGASWGWVFYDLPPNPALITPGFVLERVGARLELQGVHRDDFFFYTTDGIVLVREDGPWVIHRFDPIDPTRLHRTEGPEISSLGKIALHFSVYGRWFYLFDTESLKVFRSRTWW